LELIRVFDFSARQRFAPVAAEEARARPAAHGRRVGIFRQTLTSVDFGSGTLPSADIARMVSTIC
jgi:hypothetical protein